ncbi:MAG: hypothetical protein JXD22_16565 [Sedimentisphaerales bacterium]|nr:hypothetical protein [Sedimentisphaerales bacterium]
MLDVRGRRLDGWGIEVYVKLRIKGGRGFMATRKCRGLVVFVALGSWVWESCGIGL